MWSSDKYKSLLDSLVLETISLFYKRRNLEICYTSPSEYKIQPNGSLFNQINKSSTTNFCIDNYVKDPWREPEEVIVTLPKDCFIEREEGGVSILRILHIVATSISLFALFLTFLVYVLIPSYQNVKGKIVLVNVVFTSLLFGFLLLSHFTSPESFYLDCSTVNRLCEFLSKYSCAITGYVGYFLYMVAFAWITVLGFNFFWNIFVESLIKVRYLLPWISFSLPRLLLLSCSSHWSTGKWTGTRTTWTSTNAFPPSTGIPTLWTLQLLTRGRLSLPSLTTTGWNH